jgi:hypothetical protein
MTGELVYNTLLTQIRKDKRGMSLSPDEFNELSVIVDKRLLIAFCSRFEEDIEISSHMGFLKVMDYPIILSSGIGTLPTNYFRTMGDLYYYDTDGIMRPLDVRTSKEHSYHERDYLTKASLKYPSCVIGSQDTSKVMQIRAYPTSISTIYLNYIRDTQVPFLDYYINDTTLEKIFLAEGAQNVNISSGFTYRDGTTGIKNSLSKDFEWDVHELPWLIAYFLQAVGVAIPDELLVQIGKTDSKEIQSGEIW